MGTQITFSHTFPSYLTSEELLKVLGGLGQDLWIFASLIHLLLPISQGCYRITIFREGSQFLSSFSHVALTSSSNDGASLRFSLSFLRRVLGLYDQSWRGQASATGERPGKPVLSEVLGHPNSGPQMGESHFSPFHPALDRTPYPAWNCCMTHRR